MRITSVTGSNKSSPHGVRYGCCTLESTYSVQISVRFGKTFLNVADINSDFSARSGKDQFIKLNIIRFIMDNRRTGSWLGSGRQSREHFILHFDQSRVLLRSQQFSRHKATRPQQSGLFYPAKNESNGPGIGWDCPAVEYATRGMSCQVSTAATPGSAFAAKCQSI